MRKYNHLLTELILPQKINPSKVKNIKQKKTMITTIFVGCYQ